MAAHEIFGWIIIYICIFYLGYKFGGWVYKKVEKYKHKKFIRKIYDRNFGRN